MGLLPWPQFWLLVLKVELNGLEGEVVGGEVTNVVGGVALTGVDAAHLQVLLFCLLEGGGIHHYTDAVGLHAGGKDERVDAEKPMVGMTGRGYSCLLL